MHTYVVLGGALSDITSTVVWSAFVALFSLRKSISLKPRKLPWNYGRAYLTEVK
jgi:hypothetical protein